MENVSKERLDMMRIAFTQTLPGNLLNEEIKMHTDFFSDQLRVQYRGMVLGHRAEPFIVEYPATWFQHFKEAVFPAWLLRRFPVRKRVIEVDMRAKYPELTKAIRGETPRISYDMRSYLKDLTDE